MLKKIIIVIVIITAAVAAGKIASGKGFFTEKAGALCLQADSLLAKKEFHQAGELYNQAVKSGYVNPQVYYKLNICYKENKEYLKAMNSIDMAVSLIEKEIAEKKK